MNELKNGGGIYLEQGPQSHDDAAFEERINGITQKIMDGVTHRRRILTLQELCDMADARMQMEQFFPDVNAYFYTISGTLRGEKVTGAMFAGNCALVFAVSRAQADDIAAGGLRDTVAAANTFALQTALGVDPFEQMERDHANAGLATSASGRKVLH